MFFLGLVVAEEEGGGGGGEKGTRGVRKKREGESKKREEKNAPTSRVRRGIVRVGIALVTAPSRSLPPDGHHWHKSAVVHAEREKKKALWGDGRARLVCQVFPKLNFPPPSVVVDNFAIPIYLGTELADDDASGLDRLTAVDLDAAALCGVG